MVLGLQALIDERIWNDKADLAEAYLEWGSYAYGAKAAEGVTRDRDGVFDTRLGPRSRRSCRTRTTENTTCSIAMTTTSSKAVRRRLCRPFRAGIRPIYHNDHSRPERPVIRTLEDEIGRVVRSRVVNPKWIDGVKRHGYKGAFEIAATVDYMFAFAATTGAVRSHHFDLVYSAFIEDDDTREFIEEHNDPALKEIAERLREAIERGLWMRVQTQPARCWIRSDDTPPA